MLGCLYLSKSITLQCRHCGMIAVLEEVVGERVASVSVVCSDDFEAEK